MRCKQHFSNPQWADFQQAWQTLLSSSSPAICESNFSSVLSISPPLVASYLKETWFPLKEKFVACWANRHLHFGNLHMFRVHSRLSLATSFIHHSHSSLDIIIPQLKLGFQIQLDDHQHMEVHQQEHPFHPRLPLPPALLPVKHTITHQALSLCLRSLRGSFPEAHDNFQLYSSYIGLTCPAAIRERNSDSRPLKLAHFHPQWHLQVRVCDLPVMFPNDISFVGFQTNC